MLAFGNGYILRKQIKTQKLINFRAVCLPRKRKGQDGLGNRYAGGFK